MKHDPQKTDWEHLTRILNEITGCMDFYSPIGRKQHPRMKESQSERGPHGLNWEQREQSIPILAPVLRQMQTEGEAFSRREEGSFL